jgi:hypothetical protein
MITMRSAQDVIGGLHGSDPDTHHAAVRSVLEPGRSAASRLVRNPIRPINSPLFGGWGPRIHR